MTILTPNHIPEIPGVLDDLAERLEPLVEPLKFWLLQRPSQEGRPSGRGEIYLALESVRYQDRRTLEDNQQRAKTTIVLVFRYFDPRSQIAAYEVMSKCRKSLVGYRLPNCDPIQIESEFYSGGPEETGAHEYRQLYSYQSTFIGV